MRDLLQPATDSGRDNKLPELYAYADETARSAAELMATEGLARLPIVDRESGQVCGTLALQDLLRGRSHSIERESERLRLFGYVPAEEGGHN